MQFIYLFVLTLVIMYTTKLKLDLFVLIEKYKFRIVTQIHFKSIK